MEILFSLDLNSQAGTFVWIEFKNRHWVWILLRVWTYCDEIGDWVCLFWMKLFLICFIKIVVDYWLVEIADYVVINDFQ